MLSYRSLAMAGFLACVGGLGFALILEHGFGLAPCMLCMVQRLAMAITAVFFLIGAIHNPSGFGQWVWSLLAAAGSAFGIGMAGRHVWLQNLPPDEVPACGPSLDYLLQDLEEGYSSLQEFILTMLQGDGNCAEIDAAFLGLSIPMWTLIAFVVLTLYALATPLIAKNVDRNA